MIIHKRPRYGGRRIDERIWTFMKVCWSYEKRDRPTAKEAVERMVEVCEEGGQR